MLKNMYVIMVNLGHASKMIQDKSLFGPLGPAEDWLCFFNLISAAIGLDTITLDYLPPETKFEMRLLGFLLDKLKICNFVLLLASFAIDVHPSIKIKSECLCTHIRSNYFTTFRNVSFDAIKPVAFNLSF